MADSELGAKRAKLFRKASAVVRPRCCTPCLSGLLRYVQLHRCSWRLSLRLNRDSRGTVILNGVSGQGVANVQITDSAHTGGSECTIPPRSCCTSWMPTAAVGQCLTAIAPSAAPRISHSLDQAIVDADHTMFKYCVVSGKLNNAFGAVTF
jgi:hypothetical protein